MILCCCPVEDSEILENSVSKLLWYLSLHSIGSSHTDHHTCLVKEQKVADGFLSSATCACGGALSLDLVDWFTVNFAQMFSQMVLASEASVSPATAPFIFAIDSVFFGGMLRIYMPSKVGRTTESALAVAAYDYAWVGYQLPRSLLVWYKQC